jgi:penicillin-binding protein 1A
MTWQKFMAYAHTNAEIKPVLGVDFTPEPVIIADNRQNAGAAPPPSAVERPPTLKPGAARKLIDVADLLKLAQEQAKPAVDQAAIQAPSTNEGL